MGRHRARAVARAAAAAAPGVHSCAVDPPDPLAELVQHLARGDDVPLAWIVAHAPDGDLRRIWSSSRDVRAKATLLDQLGHPLGGKALGYLRLAQVFGAMHKRERAQARREQEKLARDVLRAAPCPTLAALRDAFRGGRPHRG